MPLHFSRPLWMWALLLLPPAIALWHWRQRRAQVWRDVVDPHLLPGLLAGGGRGGWFGCMLAALAYVLAVIALSGPSWRQGAPALFRSSMPLVVALDLSSSAEATDVPPSRLLQMRAKLATLLRERAGGEVALLAYAGESFTVAPLTQDAANVALFLDALSPSVMPQDGKRADLAIAAATQLLVQTGVRRGDILLLTDRADARARAAAQSAIARGFRVSVLGIGSPRGAAYRTARGEIAQARLDAPSLRALAALGGGSYVALSADDSDLRALGLLDPARRALAEERVAGTGKRWLDEGYWLLFPIMCVGLLAFRRPSAAAMLALACVLPAVLPVHAAEATLWWRADQLQQQWMDAGVQAYRNGDFAAAQRLFERVRTDEGWYNLGNALARQGRYDQAIAAYDRALQAHPGMPDAVANRALVAAARKSRQSARQRQNRQRQQPKQAQHGQNRSTDVPFAPHQQGQSGLAFPSQAQREAQRRADAAARARMQQALTRGTPASQPMPQPMPGQAQARESPAQREQRQGLEGWMRRVPDDPGNVLRAKFKLEHERRQREAP